MHLAYLQRPKRAARELPPTPPCTLELALDSSIPRETFLLLLAAGTTPRTNRPLMQSSSEPEKMGTEPAALIGTVALMAVEKLAEAGTTMALRVQSVSKTHQYPCFR